jgi:zinc protease
LWWATSSDFVLTHDRNIFRPKNVLLKTNLTLIALVTAVATPSLAAGPEVADFTLANGVELVVIPDHRAPVVTHMIWYKVGAADETPGKSGWRISLST